MNQTYDLEKIITAAASLTERIATGDFADASLSDDSRAQSRMKLWLDKACQGNQVKFERRLSWLNVDADVARRVVGSDPRQLTPTPSWAIRLQEMLRFLADETDMQADGFDPNILKVTPFAHGLHPVARLAMARLESQVPPAVLTASVAGSLRNNLIQRIAGICELTLGEEFLGFRSALGWTQGQGGEGATEYYDAFTAKLSQGGLVEVLAKYPVLARLIVLGMESWIADMSAFLLRFESDRAEIAHRLFGGDTLPEIRLIHSSLSDPHRGGRTVKILEFVDGRRLVYKPKSLAIDEAWMKLVAWIHEREPAADLRVPITWNRGEYGWAEYIAQAPCENRDAVRRFYHRAGILTCLFYVFHATDFHMENLIAAGDQLVPIDLETVFVPYYCRLDGEAPLIANRYAATVLHSLILPAWYPSTNNNAFDISGLGSYMEGQDGGEVLDWTDVNTDAMILAICKTTMSPARNLPANEGEAINPADFVSDVVDGFRVAYRFLTQHCEEILDRTGPAEAFRNCATRLVLRNTKTYASLLRRSVMPRLLTNGVNRSIELEVLSRAPLSDFSEYQSENLLKAELAALEQLDVPYFDADVDSNIVRGGDGIEVGGFVKQTAFQAVSQRLRSLCQDDMNYQCELIRATFAARDIQRKTWEIISRPAVAVDRAFNSGDWVKEAEAIAANIASQALWDDGAAYWIAADYDMNVARHMLRPLGSNLYSGRGGIAVFFAALTNMTGNPDYRRVALGTARSINPGNLRSAADRESNKVIAKSLGVGGGSGIASMVYSLVATSRLLKAPELLEDALEISKLIDASLIRSDKFPDVLGGSAGAVLALLPLWQETKHEAVGDLVVQCAEHLVSQQIRHNGHAGGWNSPVGSVPMTGFSHGAAGNAYALLQAHTFSGDPSFREAAKRAVEYERSVFHPAENNWPDNRKGGTFMGAWCHGAPGIGLARLGCLKHDEDEQYRGEIETALHWVKTNQPSELDHVCCGEFGNMELLMEAGRRLGRADLVAEAQVRCTSVVARAQHKVNGKPSGFQSMMGRCDSMFLPGFFNGMAGIGYQMLRLAAPDRIPSVLLWD